MVMSEKNSENHLGGVLGILRHVSELCNNVSTISMLGEKKEFLNYIKKKLPKKIKTNFIFKKNSPTIVKKRYMDQDSNYKIFGIYNINDENLTPENEKIFHKILKRDLKKYDLVIVSDYGHGFISKKSASLICKHSKFLAINTQLNAYNYSYHTIKNYKNFNTLIINEKELRNETRDKSSKIENLMMNLSKDRNLKNLVVTRGSNGSILYSRKKKQFYYADAYATNIVDKVGAGDTMLGVIAFCIESKTDYNISLLISSLAAAQSVENLGNRYSINKLNLLRALETILK